MNIRMSTKGKRPLRSLTPSDKIHAIQRIHDGESKASVARDIGVPESTLRGWCKNEDKLRFMSRQTDKMTADSLTEKLVASASLLAAGGGGGGGGGGGPPEKRQKLDNNSMPFNYSGNKSKYDEIVYKRSPIDGIDFSSNKSLTELGFNGLPTDYISYSTAAKSKVFGADISRQADPAIAAISPLSSLSHLAGLSGLAQTPLAISFNELSSNLNLLAQINPGLAAMSGLNGLAATMSNLRSVKTKNQQFHQNNAQNSQRAGECDDNRQPTTGLSVRNWAKQKPPSPSTSAGMNLCQNDVDSNKNKLKCPPSPTFASSMGKSISPSNILPDDSLLYWLKTQQSMMGLNHIYPSPGAPPIGATSPPMGPTPGQRLDKVHLNSILNASAAAAAAAGAPLTPSSAAPAFGLDDKNSAWLYWCKALGASLNSLAPAAAAAVLHGAPMQQVQPQPSPTANGVNTVNVDACISTSNGASSNQQKAHMENILFTQLTKNIECSAADDPNIFNNNNTSTQHCSKDTDDNNHASNRPEDLSARKIRPDSEPTTIFVPSPPTLSSTSPNPHAEGSPVATPAQSPKQLSATGTPTSSIYIEDAGSRANNMAECKNVLDNLLFKINNNPSVASLSKTTSSMSFDGLNEEGFSSDSNVSYGSNKNHISCSDASGISNKQANKKNDDEEEPVKESEQSADERDSEAIKYGEKFLKWLENCSNPRITATHLMQLRFLLSALKPNSNSNAEDEEEAKESCTDKNLKKENTESCIEYLVDVEEGNHLNKGRRRK